MSDRGSSTSNRTCWSGARGELEIWEPRAGVVVIRCAGHATIDFVRPIVEQLNRAIIAGQRPEVFDDWYEVTGYDTDVRVKLTEWTRKHHDAIRETHILLRSKLLAMGVAIANLAVGGRLRTYTERAQFEKALRFAVGLARTA